MLTVRWDTVRLFLHVLAATVRVGGPAQPVWLAVIGASTGLTALGALFVGIMLAG